MPFVSLHLTSLPVFSSSVHQIAFPGFTINIFTLKAFVDKLFQDDTDAMLNPLIVERMVNSYIYFRAIGVRNEIWAVVRIYRFQKSSSQLS